MSECSPLPLPVQLRAIALIFNTKTMSVEIFKRYLKETPYTTIVEDWEKATGVKLEGPVISETKTHMETTNLFRIALSMVGVGVDDRIADLILQTAHKFDSLKGEFSVSDAVDIEAAVNARHQKDEEGADQ